VAETPVNKLGNWSVPLYGPSRPTCSSQQNKFSGVLSYLKLGVTYLRSLNQNCAFYGRSKRAKMYPLKAKKLATCVHGAKSW